MRRVVPILIFLILPAMGCGTGTGGPLITFPPTLASVSPPSGPNGGGTLLTLTGTNFTPLMTVTVGGVLCLGVTVDPLGTSLTCTTVGGIAGPKDVRVETITGSATLPGAFTYTLVLSPKPVPVIDLMVTAMDGLPLVLWSDVLHPEAGDDAWCPGPEPAAAASAALAFVEAAGYHFALAPDLGAIVWYADPAAAALGEAPAGCLLDERLRRGRALTAVAR